MEDSYHETQGICSEVNFDDVIIEENALYINRSHNECDNLMEKYSTTKKKRIISITSMLLERVLVLDVLSRDIAMESLTQFAKESFDVPKPVVNLKLDFEETWEKMLDAFDLREHKWLKQLYEKHKRWSIALSNDFFSTGFLSSQRKDFHCKQSKPPLAIRASGILNHATNVYTHKLFKLFEEEFKNAIGKFWFELSSDGGVYEFKVGGMDGSRIHHILIIKNFDEIPNKYVLSRWCKNAKNRWLEEETHNVSVDGKNDDYEIVYQNNMMRNAYNIILKSQGNVKAREIVQDGLKKIDKAIENELAKLSISLDGQEMKNEVGDGKNVKETLDVNPILNPLMQRPKVSPIQDSNDT
ncbi:unnamed protein product [Dovyalis caffra]|uniref:Protein FAR1-RELATED SEQUENCE n=1 Tax=Dovyalis caffra TaxID=77055 RepID=A0AAV1S0V4_9ROSI|nr:unnamed protein product [Dovyalis caffra]